MSDEIQKLEKEIDDAFGWRVYPKDQEIAHRRPGCLDYDGERVARFFGGKDWREITIESILNGYEGDPTAFMSAMTPEGFTYFLPAFLRLSLDFDHPLDIADQLTFKLTSPESWSPEARHLASDVIKDRFQKILSLLTLKEKQTVVHVLEFLATQYEKHHYLPGPNDAQVALNSCWLNLINVPEKTS